MAISQDYIAELMRRTDITELVRGYVQLKRAGRIEKGLCPFHNEKTPSFCVYPETESFYCFGCGAGGDAITFVKKIQNLDYVEAVKQLAARAGMPLPEEDDQQAQLRSRVLAANREAARFYAAQLNSDRGRAARGYLRGRGLTDATIRGFGLGYAPDGFDALREHLKLQGYTQDDLLLAGLCKRSQRGSVYDAFRNRVMFPIIDLRGNVIAFGGRALEDKGPKYLNSSDTPVFKKSRNLFALNIAKKAAAKKYILAEGYMDVISLHQAGFTTAVATLGTALTAEQAKLLSNYTEEVAICYDADEAGQKATSRAIEIFKYTPIKVTVLQLPGAKDPDDFIRGQGADKFEQLLTGSANTIEYSLQKLKKNYDLTQADGRAAYIRAALEVLAADAKPTEQDIYAGRIAEETDVSKAAVLTQLEGVAARYRRRQAKEREKRIMSESAAAGINVPYGASGQRALGVAFAEQQLVAALLKNGEEFLLLVQSAVKPEQFISPDMQEAYRQILLAAADGAPPDLAALGALLPEKTMALLSKILAQNYDVGFQKQDVELFIQRILEAAQQQKSPAEMTGEELAQYLARQKEKKQ